MDFVRVGVTNCVFTGVKEPHLNKDGSYCVNIGLEKIGSLFCPLKDIKIGDTKIQSQAFHAKIIKAFMEARIKNGSNVAVIYDIDSCKILAIALRGRGAWIDIRDFSVKGFPDLNIIITFLEVFL